MRILLACLAFLALAVPAAAQQRQPAQITTQPSVTPQKFDLLDKTGTWVPLGATPGSATGADVRTFGCKADGTDQTACLNAALANATGCVLIPATASGFTVNGTITVTKCLRGEVWSPNAPASNVINSSIIRCVNTVAQPCVVIAGANGGDSVQIENISIVGVTTPPSNSSIGFQWTSGWNIILTNVQAINFDTCAYFGPTILAGTGPISMHSYNLMISQCRKHYIVNDGIPELYFVGGRWGGNGGHDYNSADDFVYSTKTQSSGAGGGPNSLIIDSVQINPGGRTVGCVFRWGGFANTDGGYGANKIVNSHIEVWTGGDYTGTATRGFFCMDSTVDRLPSLIVANNSMGEDGTKLMPFFNIDSAVPWGDEFRFSNNLLCGAAVTLSIGGMTGSHTPTFDNNYVCGAWSFVARDTTAILTLDNNTFASLSISGQWSSLSMYRNIFGTLTDTATGTVYEGAQITRAWTPTLSFGGTTSGGGASVGMTYTTQSGSIQRTPGGGYRANAVIVLSNKGTSTGQAHIDGLPITCASGSSVVPTVASAFTGLTGAIQVTSASGQRFAYFHAGTATGVATLSDTAFTNTSAINVNIECAKAS